MFSMFRRDGMPLAGLLTHTIPAAHTPSSILKEALRAKMEACETEQNERHVRMETCENGGMRESRHLRNYDFIMKI